MDVYLFASVHPGLHQSQALDSRVGFQEISKTVKSKALDEFRNLQDERVQCELVHDIMEIECLSGFYGQIKNVVAHIL